MKKILKGLWCLECKHMIDYDFDYDDNLMFVVCEFDNEAEEDDELDICPFYEPN